MTVVSGWSRTSGVRCFFGPSIAFSAGDMITCNGGTGFRGFNLGRPDLYPAPARRPVCIKVFRDNGDVKYDCLDVAYPGSEVDGGVCFESQDSWDGWRYICQCEGNICQSETLGLDYAEMLASRRRLVITAVSLVSLALVALAAALSLLAWRHHKTRSVRFTTGADVRESGRNGAVGNGTRAVKVEAKNGGPTPKPLIPAQAVRAVTAKRTALIHRDTELELAGPLIDRETRRNRRPEALNRRQRTRPDLSTQIYQTREVEGHSVRDITI